MSRFDDWNPPLARRRGSAVRLLGIEIHHDCVQVDARRGVNQALSSVRSLVRATIKV